MSPLVQREGGGKEFKIINLGGPDIQRSITPSKNRMALAVGHLNQSVLDRS